LFASVSSWRTEKKMAITADDLSLLA